MTPTTPQTEHHIDVIAKEKAVAFLEWAYDDGWEPYDGHDRWVNTLANRWVLSSSDLYDHFKTETQQ